MRAEVSEKESLEVSRDHFKVRSVCRLCRIDGFQPMVGDARFRPRLLKKEGLAGFLNSLVLRSHTHRICRDRTIPAGDFRSFWDARMLGFRGFEDQPIIDALVRLGREH